MIYKALLTSISIFMGLTIASAQKQITLDDIWVNKTFTPKSIPGFNFMRDGRHYTLKRGNKIVIYDITTGEQTSTLFDPETIKEKNGFDNHFENYAFSQDENLILLASDKKMIYRRSYLANYFIYNRASGTIEPLFGNGRQMNAHFSPDGKRIGFVYENNLYYKNLHTGELTQVTYDGEANAIINGAADWVYEEEFAITRTFEWSSDSRYLAWIRFDERAVTEFSLTRFNGNLYPVYETFKYPKVGAQNSTVSVHIYDTEKSSARNVDILNSETDLYVPRIKWAKSSNELTVFVLNRHQNDLKLLLTNAANSKTKLLMEEKNKFYIDIDDNLTFLEDGEHFLWTSEKEGKNQVYLYDLEGNSKKLTSIDNEVTAVYGFDDERNLAYFQATDDSPLRRAVFSVDLMGQITRLTDENQSGWNSAIFSTTFDYYVLTHQTANRPPVYSVHTLEGQNIRVIENNEQLAARIQEFGFEPKEFFTFKNREGTLLNGYVIKPTGFDPEKKYPVFMFLYGGPGSQEVTEEWTDRYQAWFQMLAQQGYMIACVDNRGTGGRGEKFKKETYMNLGKMETADQIDAANYLKSLPYTDPSRFGIFGWSYGGYMSTNLILHGNEVYNMAIAVAPVTNWRWYDSIYTERYMRTESENKKGYHDYSPVYFADKLKGDYLLIHGLADDNVHFQHSAEMVKALIKAGKEFQTMYYPNDNHSISGPGSKLHLFTLMTKFIKENL